MCPNTECVCRISHTTTCTYGFAERDSSETPIRRHQYDAAFGVVDVYGPSDAYFLYYDILVILPPMSPPSLLSMSRDGQDVILVWPVTDHRLVEPIAFVARFDLYVSTAILEISYSVSAWSRHRQDTIGYLNR